MKPLFFRHGTRITTPSGVCYTVFAPAWWRLDMWLCWLFWRVTGKRAIGLVNFTVYDRPFRMRVFATLEAKVRSIEMTVSLPERPTIEPPNGGQQDRTLN
jgi:hypothetical protein